MIRDDEIYTTATGSIRPGGPSIWDVISNDQRRLISVKMDEEQESEDTAVKYLKRNIEQIPPDAVQVSFSPNGELVSTSSHPRDDNTYCVYYPPVEEIDGLNRNQTIVRTQLEELDRFGPDVDLVMYPPSSKGSGNKVVFKYYYLFQLMDQIWDEMNILVRLPEHPNLVPFDKAVVDELTGRVVGFTIKYIPSGTLEENPSRTFKLKWLHQLLDIVDDLNLKYGISHQDIAPRNLLIDEKTDSLMLFDFNYSARIGMRPPKEGGAFRTRAYLESRNDVKGVIFTMYEIITRDDSQTEIPYHEQDLATLEKKDWKKHRDVSLDRPLPEFRAVLKEWSRKRRTGKQVKMYTEAPKFIDWPVMSDPPPTEFKSVNLDGTPTTYKMVTHIHRRADERKKGNPVINWQRPPRHELKNGVRLLATGKVLGHKK